MFEMKKGNSSVPKRGNRLSNEDYLIGAELRIDEDDIDTQRITAFENQHLTDSELKMIEKHCKM